MVEAWRKGAMQFSITSGVHLEKKKGEICMRARGRVSYAHSYSLCLRCCRPRSARGSGKGSTSRAIGRLPDSTCGSCGPNDLLASLACILLRKFDGSRGDGSGCWWWPPEMASSPAAAYARVHIDRSESALEGTKRMDGGIRSCIGDSATFFDNCRPLNSISMKEPWGSGPVRYCHQISSCSSWKELPKQKHENASMWT